MRTLCGAVAFLLASGCLVAQEKWNGDGTTLLSKCTLAVRAFDGEKLSSSDAVEGEFCVGYVLGVHDMDFTVQMLEEHEKVSLMKHACSPSNASTGQAVRVVVKYLRDNPERLHMPASVLITDAVRSAFPCK
jgi:hypothetical protein